MSSGRPPERPWDVYRDPAVRNYLFVTLSSLLVVGAVFFVRGGLPAALIPVMIAVLGVIGRWTAMPVLFQAVTFWFLVFPYGLPYNPSPYSDIPGSPFRLLDLVLVGAVATYLAGQYRLFGLAHQAMPTDFPPGPRPKGLKPIRRPGRLVAPEEMGRMFAVLGVCVLGGQLVWLALVVLRVAVCRFPPVVLADDPFAPFPRRGSEVDPSEPVGRFLLLAGLAGAAAVGLGLAFWYWRLLRLSREEVRMALLDAEWGGARRELNRQEKWRAWARNRRLKRLARRPRPPAEPRSGCRTGLILLAVVAGVVLVWCCLFCGLSAWVIRRM